MLGKTNITVLQEGGVITEIEDFTWIRMQSGIGSDFIKTIYNGGYLVGMTQDGYVAYTADGEVWENSKLDYNQCKLNDIDWDGEKFIIVGCYVDAGTEDMMALAVTTTNFTSWDPLASINDGKVYAEYLMIYKQNSKYILAAREKSTEYEYLILTDFTAGGTTNKLIQENMNGTSHRGSLVAKKTAGALLYIRSRAQRSPSDSHDVYKIANGDRTRITGISSRDVGDIYRVFECKDALYIQKLSSKDSYDLCKITDAGEIMTISTGVDFGFVSGVYYDGCQLFISRHEMMIIRKGESFADKTLDDLLEIAPEMNMNCIEKAFGQLYVFGDKGVILKSNAEADNEEAIAVQVISAKRALKDAKAYTDEKYKVLESRIAALEAR